MNHSHRKKLLTIAASDRELMNRICNDLPFFQNMFAMESESEALGLAKARYPEVCCYQKNLQRMYFCSSESRDWCILLCESISGFRPTHIYIGSADADKRL